jgi:hypothetical protein
MKWRYSLRTMRVRCILVETTVPVRIRPRIETWPVKGHFLSIAHHQYMSFQSAVEVAVLEQSTKGRLAGQAVG